MTTWTVARSSAELPILQADLAVLKSKLVPLVTRAKDLDMESKVSSHRPAHIVHF